MFECSRMGLLLLLVLSASARADENLAYWTQVAKDSALDEYLAAFDSMNAAQMAYLEMDDARANCTDLPLKLEGDVIRASGGVCGAQGETLVGKLPPGASGGLAKYHEGNEHAAAGRWGEATISYNGATADFSASKPFYAAAQGFYEQAQAKYEEGSGGELP